MEKVTTKDQLMIHIENLISAEKLARDRYSDESSKFKCEKICSCLKEIKKDEDRHVEMLENLLEKLKE